MSAPVDDDILIRPIRPADAEAFCELRLEALRRHPLSFTADLAEAEARTPEAWREQVAEAGGEGKSVILLADAGGALAGMAGVYMPAQPKLAHSGVVWGVYVRDAHRGRGVGSRLVNACADWARGKAYVGLKLSAVQGNGAVRCYEQCGFTAYGVEPFAVRWEGKLYDETLMALRFSK